MLENLSEITWFIPVHTVSEANSREHWHKAALRHCSQKKLVQAYFWKERPKITLPCAITLVRIGKRKLDSDNLPVSMKYIRDAIADCLIPGLPPGRADGDMRLSWQYDQKKAYGNAVGIEITFIFRKE